MTIPRAGTCRPSVFLRADYHRPVQTRSQTVALRELHPAGPREPAAGPHRRRAPRPRHRPLARLLRLALIPVALISLAIVLSSGRPVLYRGTRVGRGGEFYTMLKFRTLRSGAEQRLGAHLGEELVFRTKEERTTVGRWLRATQLDELPQLLNVLRGDMSLVGPRPIRPIFFEQLASDLPAYWQRLVVRPGPDRVRAGAARLRDVDGREARARHGVDRRPLRRPLPADARRHRLARAAPVAARGGPDRRA